ncbi:MAG: hypothetical protein K5767_00395 [Clostridia bacterium]|nr:hypothetical protein [Clostridia bacterium]
MNSDIKKYGRLIAALVLLAAAIIMSSMMIPSNSKASSSSDSAEASENPENEITVEEGRTALEKLTLKSVAEVEAQLEEQDRIRRAEAMSSGNFNAVFSDAMIIGDSHMEGMTAYGLLDPARVAAIKGRSLSSCEEDIEKAVNMAPQYIFLNYGMNDAAIYGSNTEKFVNRYKEVITGLQEKLPDSKIFICSIFPAQEAAYAKTAFLAYVPAYNEALAQMCDEMGLTFIDTTGIMTADDYEPDHIHTNKGCHQKWLGYVALKSGLVTE